MKIVLTGGKFNRIHPGHLWLLKRAKKLGRLVVVIAHDAHNKRHYAVSSGTRKRNLEALKIAYKIVVGDRKKFVNVVKKYRPGVIVLGYDQRIPDKETGEYVKKNGIRVVKFRKYGNHSTRNL